MVKFILARPGAPWDYPTLGFIATANGAILDGTLFTPDLEIPPDAYWSVYGGGSAETSITRYALPSADYLNPVPEDLDGSVLVYSVAANTFVPTPAADAIEAGTALGDALSASIDQATARPNGGPFARINKAETSQLRVHVYGTSVTAGEGSPVQVALAQLKRLYGSVGEVFVRAGELGGTYNASSGWKKQWYGGLHGIRARGDSASTVLKYYAYFDTYELANSRETNSEAVNFVIDGVTVGTTPAAGAQAYNQKIAGTVALGIHEVVINVPAGAGYVYWEYLLLYDSTQPGILALNFALGSSLMKNMTSLGTPTGDQVAGIAPVGNNGVDAHYDRTDADLFINGHIVNDIADPTTVGTLLEAARTRVNTNGRHLVNVSEMAGHFTQTGDSGKAGYDTIRALHKALPVAHDYVTHVDWDGATRMTQAEMDGAAYSTRYYTLPDFIHPNQTGMTVGVALMCKALGIPPPAEAQASVIANDAVRRPRRVPTRTKVATRARVIDYTHDAVGATDIITTRKVHGLAVGDRVVFQGYGISGDGLGVVYYVKTVPAVNQITISTTLGGATLNINDIAGTGVWPHISQLITGAPLAIAGYARQMMPNNGGSKVVPYYSDPTALNILKLYNDSIQASGTSDKYGKYLSPSSTVVSAVDTRTENFGLMTVTMRAAGAVSVRPGAPWRICDPAGNVTTLPGAGYDIFNVSVDAASTVEPVVYTFHILNPTTTNTYLVVTAARIYEMSWVYGDLPVLGC